MHKSNFWDKMGEVDREKDKVYIILRVLQFGTQKDMKELKNRYSLEDILEVAKKYHYNLDNLTRNYLNLIYDLHLPLNTSLNEITSG